MSTAAPSYKCTTSEPRTEFWCGAVTFVGLSWYTPDMADMTPAGRAARRLDAIAAELDRMVLLRRYAPPPARLRQLAEQIRQATAIVNEARLTAEGQPLPAPIVIEPPACVR